MFTSATNSPGQLSSLACPIDQDAACGLEYAASVLETGGLPDALSASEAPKLNRAAGGQLISHAVLAQQIDDAARVVATDPASVPLIQRVRETTNAVAETPKEPISSKALNFIAVLGSIFGTVLGVLPYFNVIVNPWIAVGVFAVGLGALLLQLFNDHVVSSRAKRARSEHEDAILALIKRADEIRAQTAMRARQTTFVNITPPGGVPTM